MNKIKPMTVIRDAFSIKKVIEVGGSYALLLPRDWVDVYCDEVEGSFWLEINYNGKELTVAALNIKDLERLSSHIKEVKDDRSAATSGDY